MIVITVNPVQYQMDSVEELVAENHVIPTQAIPPPLQLLNLPHLPNSQ
jgi:hypothetical protein